MTESMQECAGKEGIEEMEELLDKEWSSSMMLVVLAKIGLDKPNPEYLPFIKKMLACEESIGMIGKY